MKTVNMIKTKPLNSNKPNSDIRPVSRTASSLWCGALSYGLLLGLGLSLTPSLVVAASPVTNYEYDANGNLTKITDGLGHATVQQFDALNRLAVQSQSNPNGAGQLGTIITQYNAIDQVTSVTDPRNLTNSYNPNAFGEVLNLTSPDTGVTTNTYDDAGNLKTKQDAKGQITTYSYDALNRLTQVVYADTSQVIYSYDQGTNGAGHLTGISDSTGTIAYGYDSLGHVTSAVHTISGMIYTSSYAYDGAGLLSNVAYPTGLVLSYTRDSVGRISSVSALLSNNQTQVLASNITYLPFGGVSSFNFGNGTVYSRGYDTDYRLASYTLGNKTINLNYDMASRIVAATDAANSTSTKTYGYDNLDRLTNFVDNTTTKGYGYDLSGNRVAASIGGNSYSNTIAANSNRLTDTTGPTAKNYVFDSNGSITTAGSNQYSYDTRGRLAQAISVLGTTSYGVNALGQRVLKSRAGVNAINTVYHYDLNGQLIAETDANGVAKQEVIYLGNIPLAVIQ